MTEIKFGVSQVNKPSPVGYRNFANAMIIFILPGAATIISGWGLPDLVAKHWLMVLAYAPAIVKAIGVFIGNGQYYTDGKESIPVSQDNVINKQ